MDSVFRAMISPGGVGAALGGLVVVVVGRVGGLPCSRGIDTAERKKYDLKKKMNHPGFSLS